MAVALSPHANWKRASNGLFAIGCLSIVLVFIGVVSSLVIFLNVLVLPSAPDNAWAHFAQEDSSTRHESARPKQPCP